MKSLLANRLITLAWSDKAREAALEARRQGHAPGSFAEARAALTHAGYPPEVKDLGNGKTNTRLRDPNTGGTLKLDFATDSGQKYLITKPAEGKTSGGWSSNVRDVLDQVRLMNKPSNL